MKYLGALIGAAVGGLIGAAAWAGIAYATGYEIGYVAWGVGVVAGFGTAAGCKRDGDALTGLIAAVLALASIALGKYGAIHFLVEKELPSAATTAQYAMTDEDMLVVYADEIVSEWEQAGKKISWPANVVPEEASTESDYPKPVWAEARKRWGALSADAQDSARQEREKYNLEMMEFRRATIKQQAFKDSFSAFDILWAVFALGSAFAIGRGGDVGGDD